MSERPEQVWLESAVKALQAPKNLKERNIIQLVLADRYSIQFRVSKLQALVTIAKAYGNHFPN